MIRTRSPTSVPLFSRLSRSLLSSVSRSVPRSSRAGGEVQRDHLEGVEEPSRPKGGPSSSFLPTAAADDFYLLDTYRASVPRRTILLARATKCNAVRLFFFSASFSLSLSLSLSIDRSIDRTSNLTKGTNLVNCCRKETRLFTENFVTESGLTTIWLEGVTFFQRFAPNSPRIYELRRWKFARAHACPPTDNYTPPDDKSN